MIGVLIIPTGIGAEIGGHAGDGNPVAKLIASCCDKLITHPNVVNASDINEMTENTLYVEGSILDRFLEGKIELKEIKSNKILVVANSPITNDTINAVSAARATVGIDAEIVELETSFEMTSKFENNIATGEVTGWRELIKQVKEYKFDALAIHSSIDVDRDVLINYYKKGGLNPYGGVEAKASKLIANELNKPVAHAPLEDVTIEDEELYYIYDRVIDPRLAPEAISNCYLHSVLKGLFKAPRIGNGLSVQDVDFLITPINCVGRPHKACLERNIPIIAVKENKTCLNDEMSDEFIIVENYLEAVGIIQAMKIGISPKSVCRPLAYTVVHKPEKISNKNNKNIVLKN
ncbi:MAG: DUF3326 domain-containing protein [Candidatus Thermoplasmatota archaeon]|nr:DUF3326 domain-containing protein [Candidatus Thermoplasmatota archaeon]